MKNYPIGCTCMVNMHAHTACIVQLTSSFSQTHTMQATSSKDELHCARKCIYLGMWISMYIRMTCTPYAISSLCAIQKAYHH